MKNMLLMAAIAAVMVVRSGAGAAELPTFELKGFPITPHQVAVMGGTNVHEQSPTPSLMLGGMPASPHQVSVLTARSTIAADVPNAKLVKSGSSVP